MCIFIDHSVLFFVQTISNFYPQSLKVTKTSKKITRSSSGSVCEKTVSNYESTAYCNSSDEDEPRQEVSMLANLYIVRTHDTKCLTMFCSFA